MPNSLNQDKKYTWDILGCNFCLKGCHSGMRMIVYLKNPGSTARYNLHLLSNKAATSRGGFVLQILCNGF